MKETTWKLKDIIMVGFVSIVFAVIYLAVVYLASFVATLLTPAGLAPLGNEIFFGVWFMAATFIGYIVQKPGVAIVAEVLAALIEVLMGSMYGPMVIVSGIIQGAGAELVFAAFRYRKYNMGVMCLAAAGCCVTSFLWGLYYSALYLVAPGMLLLMFCIRMSSSILFAGILCKVTADAMVRTGLLRSYPLGLAR